LIFLDRDIEFFSMTLTTSQAAERLGVSVSRVQQFIKAGRLPAEKVGRDYLIQAADLAKVKNRKPGRPRRTDRR
jgi:excisionase family DNA binding protein